MKYTVEMFLEDCEYILSELDSGDITTEEAMEAISANLADARLGSTDV